MKIQSFLTISFLVFFSCTYVAPKQSETSSSSGGGDIVIDAATSGSGGLGGNNGDSGMVVGSSSGFGGSYCAPSIEICNGKDDDCDGKVDNSTSDSGAYCGFSGTLWIGSHDGLCNYGKMECLNGKLECLYDPVMPELCGDMLDNDCNGKADENCPCIGNEMLQCYSGNPDAIGIGNCKWGSSYCNNGMNNGVCSSFTPQMSETCNLKDDDCDGVIDNVSGGCP